MHHPGPKTTEFVDHMLTKRSRSSRLCPRKEPLCRISRWLEIQRALIFIPLENPRKNILIHPQQASLTPCSPVPALVVRSLLRNLLHHLPPRQTAPTQKRASHRANNHVVRHADAVAVLGADPANKQGVGTVRLSVGRVVAGEGVAAVRLGRLLLEELVDGFHLGESS